MAVKVIYDHDIFIRQKHGGISRSFAEIINRLNLIEDIQVKIPFYLSLNAHLRKCSSFRGITLDIHFRGLKTMVKMLDNTTFLPALLLSKTDVYHQTFYNPNPVRLCSGLSLVMTIHDMAPDLYPEYFINAGKVHAGKREMCKKAAAVICDSHFTKKDLLQHYKIDPVKVYVIHLGGGITAEPSMENNKSIPGRYILYVGMRRGLKNFRELARAVVPLMKKNPGLHLICAGGGEWTSSELRLFEPFRILTRVHQVSPSDKELAYYYRHAELFVYPSLYEGFGLPILEAFQYGCPVVASRRSCFPEIAGDAAEYFEPGEEGSLIAAMEAVILNKEHRRELIMKGFQRRTQFSWERTAQSLAGVYRKVASF